MARDDLFTIVHEQFLTDTAQYADIVLPATTHIESSDVTTAWGHLWMGWNEAAIAAGRRSGQQPRGVPPDRAGDGPHRAVAVRRRPHDPARVPRPGSTSTRCGATAGCGCRSRRTVAPGRTAASRPRRARSSSSASGSSVRASHACRRSSPPVEGPQGPGAARFPLQLMTPEAPRSLPELRLLAPPEARPRRGRPVRRARRRRRRGAGPRRGRQRPRVQRPRQPRAAGEDQRAAPARPGARSRGAGGATTIPTARSPTASPTTRSTEWGGGVAFSDTLVQVERADLTSVSDPVHRGLDRGRPREPRQDRDRTGRRRIA